MTVKMQGESDEPMQPRGKTSKAELEWRLSATGTFDQVSTFVQQYGYSMIAELPAPYELTDVSPFSPSGAIYFMNGWSSATIRLISSGEELTFTWTDENTSIAASAPLLYDEKTVTNGIYVPVPPPLKPVAYYPKRTPDRYKRDTTLHLMQVVSMNMRSEDGQSRLLIGLPFVEKYPKIFYSGVFEEQAKDASSYGVVQSLTNFTKSKTGRREVQSNGYPALSFFGIYHLLETRIGAFFNKRATQMELQPSAEGKLALSLPPIPFLYELLNGPIALYDVNDPNGEPVAELIEARHGSHLAAQKPTPEDWPYHQIDLKKIEDELKSGK